MTRCPFEVLIARWLFAAGTYEFDQGFVHCPTRAVCYWFEPQRTLVNLTLVVCSLVREVGDDRKSGKPLGEVEWDDAMCSKLAQNTVRGRYKQTRKERV